jgi:hypothetical protein
VPTLAAVLIFALASTVGAIARDAEADCPPRLNRALAGKEV